jgi:RimJ/RimL family protein N-acetyltransferase
VNAVVSLIPINRNGTLRGYAEALPELMGEVLQGTVGLYTTAGFEEPWICYLALASGTPVGTCGFKSPPRDGRVEIAYFTFPEAEGRGIATAMAAALVAIAKPFPVIVAAQTLPERNASHRVLEKLGFRYVETVFHPEDGSVWEWRLSEASDA